MGAYPYGQCTYYAKSVYPGLPDDMGNGKDWINSARRYGFPISAEPRVGWIVSYVDAGQYDATYGHVAVVIGINADGTFDVEEMNYTAFAKTDKRTSTTKGVIGFFMPPGAPGGQYAMPVGTGVTGTPAAAASTAQGSDPGIGGFVGVLVNGLMVLGGVAIAALGIAIAVMNEKRITQPVLQGVEKVQKGSLAKKKAEYAEHTRRNREFQRARRKRPSIDGPNARRSKADRAAQMEARMEAARKAQQEQRAEYAADQERALQEIPF